MSAWKPSAGGGTATPAPQAPAAGQIEAPAADQGQGATPAPEAPPTDQVVKAYIRLRDARSELTQEYERRDAALKAKMEVLESHLQGVCKAAGGNVTTAHGIIIRQLETNYWTSDWESMHAFIKENDALGLLQRRISQKAMAEFLQNNPDKVPKGLNSDSSWKIIVRRK